MYIIHNSKQQKPPGIAGSDYRPVSGKNPDGKGRAGITDGMSSLFWMDGYGKIFKVSKASKVSKAYKEEVRREKKVNLIFVLHCSFSHCFPDYRIGRYGTETFCSN